MMTMNHMENWIDGWTGAGTWISAVIAVTLVILLLFVVARLSKSRR